MSVARPIVVLHDLVRRYGEGDQTVYAVRNVSLELESGEFLMITGPSGSGKTTLLNLVAGLDRPTSGEVRVDGRPIQTLSARELARLRRQVISVVFQFFNLLPTLTVAQNVAIPLRADHRPRTAVRERVERVLALVGLSHRAHHYPGQLSGGEMQRATIARSLATDARIILADEPTGNLDTARGEEILGLLREAADRDRRAIMLVTHDQKAARFADRQVRLEDGRLVDGTGASGPVA